MRRFPLALVAGLIAFAGTPADAQHSFHDLSQHVETGKWLQIEDSSGAKTTGRLKEIGADAITLTLEDGTRERQFPRDTIVTVAQRRRYGKRGALVGAASLSAVLGLVECPGDDPHEQCGDAILDGALMGAGLGAIIGALTSRFAVVYQAENTKPSVSLATRFMHRRAGIAAVIRW